MFKGLGMAFSDMTCSSMEGEDSSSESTILVCGISISKTLAILGKARKFKNINKTDMFKNLSTYFSNSKNNANIQCGGKFNIYLILISFLSS